MGTRLAIVLSAAALLVSVLSLSPVGEAARELVVPSNSVGTTQLKHNAVTASKLAPGAVRAGHIAPGAVTGAKIKAGTLGTEHFQTANLPKGPKGDKGDRGQKGDRGPSDAFARYGTVAQLTSADQTLATMTLPAGKYVVQSHVVVHNASTTASTALCKLTTATESIGEDITLDGGDIVQHNLFIFGDLPRGGTTVSLVCRSQGTFMIPSRERIVAIKVATLSTS